MQVIFQKTGESRYGVIIQREGFSNLEMNPAPGFDPLMPHDLLHFLVEQEFDLRNGIYGQIAAGGTAGTFHQVSSEKSNARADSRLRRKTARRGGKLLQAGLDDCAKSERATYVCLYNWFLNSANEDLCLRAREMKSSVENTFAKMTESERKKFTEEKLAQIRLKMDDLSKKWSSLKVSESITLNW